MPWQTETIPFVGGLDLYENLQLLAQQPNKAIRLRNFEPAVGGGYRRINGYQRFGTASVPGTGNIQGVLIYQGVVVARNGNLYHSTDGNAWTQIPDVTLSTTNDIQGVTYEVNSTTETLVVTDGTSQPYYINYDGTTFTASTPNVAETAGASNPVIIGERLAISVGTQLITSNRFDIDEFDAGFQANLLINVVALRAFRDRLIIFGRNQIKQALNIDDHSNTSIRDITARIGCVDGGTVQEIGGDLIFLAPDGLRTVAATERIDDIELSVLSRPIRPLTDRLVNNLEGLKFTSTVIRDTSQYRLYTFDSAIPNELVGRQVGIIASLIYSDQGQTWQFAETRGFPVHALVDGILDNEEVSYFGTPEGEIHVHNVGSDFNGTAIRATFNTPFFSLNDFSLRKTVHSVNPFILSEGVSDGIVLTLRYNYNDAFTHQPKPFPLEPFVEPSIYGESRFTEAIYGATPDGARRINVEGSGFTVQLRFASTGGDPYVIQGFNLDFSYGGKV